MMLFENARHGMMNPCRTQAGGKGMHKGNGGWPVTELSRSESPVSRMIIVEGNKISEHNKHSARPRRLRRRGVYCFINKIFLRNY